MTIKLKTNSPSKKSGVQSGRLILKNHKDLRTVWCTIQRNLPFLRDRNLKTSNGYWRMRVTLPVVIVAVAVGAPLFYQVNNIATSIGSQGAIAFSSVIDNKFATVENLSTSTFNAASIAKLEPILPKGPYLRKASYSVESGDTLSDVLERADIGSKDRTAITSGLQEAGFDPRKLKAGQGLSVEAMVQPDGEKIFKGMDFKVSPFKHYRVASAGGNVIAKAVETPMQDVVVSHALTINGSVYESMRKAGVPKALVGNFLKPFGHFVDFQRDIRAGQENKVEVLYNGRQTIDGAATVPGDIVYASLELGAKRVSLYRFKTEDGGESFYTEDGKSGKRLLMKTPINGARLSSGFGMRRHPVLGYSKMHKGVDFAASRGTPIYAAGDGVVEKAGPFSSYGNYVMIRHSGGYKTAYAHMQGYAKGMRAGKRVQQGDVIGYVGTTGRSTGPHLHYEVIQGGKQVNPNGLKMSGGIELVGGDKTRFKAEVARIQKQFKDSQKSSVETTVQQVSY